MNLTITPIKFNNFNFALKKSKNEEQNSYAQKNLLNLDSSLALKNQILFKGTTSKNRKEELIQKAIKENSIPIKSETLNFILSKQNFKMGLYEKYARTGSKFFELFSRYYLHKDYPIKDEGELTDIVVFFIKDENKSKITKDFIPNDLLSKTNDKKTAQHQNANCLNAILGAIIYENEDGFKKAYNFLNEIVAKNIYPSNLDIEESSLEKLANVIESKGNSWQNLYQETRFYDGKWHYRIHYKNLILSQAQGDRRNHDVREQCIKEATRKIESGEVNLDFAKDDLNYINYKIPDSKRIEELEDFCQNWGLEFKDISLLHQAFLYGEMQDGSALAHCDTYEILEYIGDAVLGFCTHEILQNNLSNAPRKIISAKRHAFVKNSNLSILAQEMNLERYTINRDKARGEKRTADMFEALIGAIFLDGKEKGIDNVYKFLDNNFKDKICSMEC